MKTLKCTKCGRTQKEGKFCLDCGGQITEVITTGINFKPIGTKRTADQLKRDVRNWLSRIGAQPADIIINLANDKARIEYTIHQITYQFSSHLQKNASHNLAAIEQFLHYRVLGIERGIETSEQAFAGYEALPDFSDGKLGDPYLIFGFKKKVPIDEVRKKFKLLAKQYHPDINPNKQTHTEFNRIKEAMELIEKEVN